MINKSRTKTSVIHTLVWLAITVFAYLPFSKGGTSLQSDYPRKPIEIVVPFKAGGGSDVLVRMFQKTINKNNLLPAPLVIVNRPGASATDGSRFVKDSKADGYTILNLHDAIIISKHFGNVTYGPESFDSVAGTVLTGLVVVVNDKSSYNSLSDLVADAQKRPSQVIVGCAMGTPTHVVGLLIEKSADVKFNLIQSGGGSARLESLMGDHVDVSVFSVSEFMNFKSQGLKALAYMGAKRHPELPELPTAKESGVDAEFDVMQYWWFPKGTDKGRTKIIIDAFREALKDEELLAFIKKTKTTPDFITGLELQKRIQKIESKIKNIEAGDSHELPPFHLIVMVTLGLFFSYILWDNYKKKKSSLDLKDKESINYTPAVVTISILALYVFLMGTGFIDFRILTFGFMLILGLFLSSKKAISKTVLVECCLLISLGTYFVFTNIVHVDLP